MLESVKKLSKLPNKCSEQFTNIQNRPKCSEQSRNVKNRMKKVENCLKILKRV